MEEISGLHARPRECNLHQDCMKIAVAIMAYNEERNIGATITSLSKQSLFSSLRHEVVVHVVPNGCRDATAERASEAFEKFALLHPKTKFQVNTIEVAGKANAWNRFVHDFSAKDADALLFLDADIQFGQPECLIRVVESLEANSMAVVAVDLPLKDISIKGNLDIRERISVTASQLQLAGPPKIAGSLYLARVGAVRSFWMPLGLIVEDGFVKAMLLTDSFRKPENLEGIVRADGATHFFEAVTGFGAWFQHERRLVNGTAVNILLFGLMRQIVAKGGDPGEEIRKRNETDPEWVSKFAKNYRGLLPGAWQFISNPLKQHSQASSLHLLKTLPIGLLRAFLNIGICFVCQLDVRAGRLRW